MSDPTKPSHKRAFSWMPIESAPRDGTRVLLHDPARRGDKTLVGYFARGNFLISVSGAVITPRYWMPLPNPNP